MKVWEGKPVVGFLFTWGLLWSQLQQQNKAKYFSDPLHKNGHRWQPHGFHVSQPPPPALTRPLDPLLISFLRQDLFKLFHYVAHTSIGKWAGALRLNVLLVRVVRVCLCTRYTNYLVQRRTKGEHTWHCLFMLKFIKFCGKKFKLHTISERLMRIRLWLWFLALSVNE